MEIALITFLGVVVIIAIVVALEWRKDYKKMLKSFDGAYAAWVKSEVRNIHLRAKNAMLEKKHKPVKDKNGYFHSPITGKFVKKPKLLDPIAQEAHAAYKRRA